MFYANPSKTMKSSELDRLADALENPGKYTDEEINTLLSDPELMETYRLMAATRSALAPRPDVDTDAAWQDIVARRQARHRRPWIMRLMTRQAAAAVAAVAISVAAVATGISIRSSLSAPEKKAEAPATVAENAVAVTPEIVADTVIMADSTTAVVVTFKDERLDNLLAVIAREHGVKVEFRNPEARSIRLFFTWRQGTSLKDIVAQLDNFEQLDITLSDNTIIVD